MSGLRDRDIEQLLGGKAPGGLEDLSVLVQRVRREGSVPVDSAVERKHVAAAAAAVGKAPTPQSAPGPTTRTTWRKRTVFAGLFSTIVGKILVGAAALAAAAAGAGAAGAFPDPVDRFFGVDHEPVREQLREQEQLGGEQPANEPNLFEYQERFEFGNQGEETIQNRFQHQNEFQRRVRPEELDETAFLFRYRHSYQGGNETTTPPHSHQLEHQQGVDQGTNPTVPQNQQQAQQQGLDDATNTTQQQQQQQLQQGQQQGTGDETTGSTSAGAANGGPGGSGKP